MTFNEHVQIDPARLLRWRSRTPEHCRTGADANTYVDCRVVLTAQSLDAVWGTELPEQTGVAYEQPGLRLFTGSVATGCGYATSEVGPFYCPADRTAYFDVGFFQELVDRFGAASGPLAQEYVVAHEFGHHIQPLLGDIGRAQQDPQSPESGAVRTESQADCDAGIWAHCADRTPAPGSNTPLLHPLGDTDPRRPVGGGSGRRRPDPAGGAGPGEPGGVNARGKRTTPEVVSRRLPHR